MVYTPHPALCPSEGERESLSKPLARPREYLVNEDVWLGGRGRMAWTPPLDFKAEVGRGLNRKSPFVIMLNRRFSLHPSFPDNNESDFVGRLWFAPLTPPSAPRKGRGSRCPSPLARPHEYLVNDDVWLGDCCWMAWTPPLDFKAEVGSNTVKLESF
jgi:hypothetical protein